MTKTDKVVTIADREFRSTWTGRSLSNYKSMHRETAAKKGKGAELQAARTLTEARVVVFGEKNKAVGICSCFQPGCKRYGHGKPSSNC